ncbi:transglycosylase SLT domain-containing protein [Rhodoplanes serenus]|uniref:Transglycosylase SLT domain-containing protein n=1 Tax=Rhodoplanes serenus TaxID=200615 RepID=A0A9X4XPB7_9BRAD|nr:transglycosylase SLT domain-containing protein [Rhodoplanes serenus]
MAVSASLSATSGWAVNDAIRTASRNTGASFEYLLATAKVESDFNPRAAAGTSSARGLFQFIDQTWLTMVKEAGPALGLGRYADAITRTPSGRYEVVDPAQRQAVMSLRSDPAANAAMAGAFTRRNADRLEARLGRPPSEGELYIAHFLGAGGAAKLITQAGRNPSGIAAEAFPQAAAANRSIFYDRSGAPRSFAQVYGVLVGRFDQARTSATQMAAAAVVTPVAATRTADRLDPELFAPSTYQPDAARTASSPLFHSLFQDEPQRAGVSRFITELWASRPHVAAALSGAVAQAAPGSLAATDPTRAAELFAAPGVGAAGLYGNKG